MGCFFIANLIRDLQYYNHLNNRFVVECSLSVTRLRLVRFYRGGFWEAFKNAYLEKAPSTVRSLSSFLGGRATVQWVCLRNFSSQDHVSNHHFTMIKASVHAFFWAWLLCTCLACGTDTPPPTDSTDTPEEPAVINRDFTVRVFLQGDPGDLNVVLTKNGYATTVLEQNVHVTLLEINPNNYDEFHPYLALSRPTIEEQDNGLITMHYEIRPEANWDNGTPITAEDFAFTLKAIKNPLVNAVSLRPLVDFIQDIKIDPTNPKKFTLYCNLYHLAEASTGTLSILPAYFYDAQGLLTDFTVAELNDKDNKSRLTKDQRLIDFAQDFNNNYSDDAEQIVGGGPYKIAEVNRGQLVRLERKENWWGENVEAERINAYPKTLLYRILSDENNAITALKEQELDVMTYIPEDRFLEMQDNERMNKHFNLYAAPGFAYRYIGLNMKDPKLEDVRVRRAIAHLVDKESVVNDLSNGLATAVNGPVSPLKPHFKKDIPTVAFNIEKAIELLEEAGWTDTDGDNIRDKVVNGERMQLRLRFIYAQGKQFYKDVAKILKDEASRVGIDIALMPLEWSVMLDRLGERDYELSAIAWGQGPTLDDFKPVWHTESDTRSGSNMVGFGNAESDALIEQIRITTDDEGGRRTKLYHRFQDIVAEQQPYVFLVAPKICAAVHKRFKNAPVLSMRPGFTVRLFQLDEDYPKE